MAVALLKAFIVGGLICTIAQMVIDLTPFQITPGHVLVSYVVTGAVLSGIGIYQPLVEFAGAGASVPLSGFGNLLVQGVLDEVATEGLIGIFTGGIKAAALGITIALISGFTVAMVFRPKG